MAEVNSFFANEGAHRKNLFLEYSGESVAILSRYGFYVILLWALCLRLIGLSKGLWLDEAYTVNTIGLDGFTRMLRSLSNDVHPPLYYVLLKLWSKIYSTEEFLRLFSVLFSMLAIGLVGLWIKRYSKTASILAALYFATAPLLLRYSQEIRQYALLLVATTLAFICSSRIAAQPENRSAYVYLSLALLLAVSVHLAGVFLFLSVWIFTVLNCKQRSRKSVTKKMLAAFALPFAAFLGYFLLPTNTGFYGKSWMPAVSFALVWRTAAALFGLLNASWPLLVLSGIVSLLILFGSWKRNLPFLVAASVFWLQALIYSIFATPVFFFRTLIPSLVPLVGFVALQLSTICFRRIRLVAMLACMLLFSLFALNWSVVQAKEPVEGYKDAMGILQEQIGPHSSLLIYPNYVQLPVGYYLKNKPDISLTVINSNSTPEEMRRAVRASQRHPVSDVFLVTRLDSTFVAQSSTFSNLLFLIKDEGTRAGSIHVFVMLSGDRFNQPVLIQVQSDFFRRLNDVFGNPVSFQDRGLYTISSWRMK